MRKSFAVLLVLFAGCASAQRRPAIQIDGVSAEPQAIPAGITVARSAPDMRGVLHLIGRHTLAHACPVSPSTVLTAAHVADLGDPTKGEPVYAPYRFSNDYDEEGIIAPLAVAEAEDVAVMKVSVLLQHYYPIAAGPPKPGDSLWFMGYDYRKAQAGFAPRVYEAEALRVVANHVIYRSSGENGSSGSCVLNSLGEVVAINIAGKRMHNDSEVGIGVGTWGMRELVQP